MEFYETEQGRRFFGVQLPQLIESLQAVADRLNAPRPAPVTLSAEVPPDYLCNLFFGALELENESQTEAGREISHKIIALQEEMAKQFAPQQQKLVEQYGELVNDRIAIELPLLFQTGYRTAMRMIFAGLTTEEATA